MQSIIKIATRPNINIEIQIKSDQITQVFLHPSDSGFVATISDASKSPVYEGVKPETQVIIQWLFDYAAKKTSKIILPFAPLTFPAFTRQVLEELQKISFGVTTSYSALAHMVGNPRACRAVGGACGRNPFPLFIPCHRVVAEHKKLGGFSCGLSIKRELLDFEAAK